MLTDINLRTLYLTLGEPSTVTGAARNEIRYGWQCGCEVTQHAGQESCDVWPCAEHDAALRVPNGT